MKALVVDDSRAMRLILAKAVRDLGYEVCEASDGEQAIAIAAENAESLAFALVDWNMPVMNGLEVVRQIRRNPALAAVVIVMVTTETDLDEMASALEAGANEYVMKPFTREILFEKLGLAGVHTAPLAI